MKSKDKTVENAAEAQRVLNFLASMHLANSTVTRAVLQEMLLSTDGQMFKNGELHDIKSKHIGAGIYKVWTEKQC